MKFAGEAEHRGLASPGCVPCEHRRSTSETQFKEK